MLIVEDDPELRRLLVTVLTDEGFEPFVAVDGDHATRSAKALEPDLILLDIHVPSSELAFRFTRDYRARHTGPGAPIVVVSGDSDIEAIAREIGADDLLRKPFGIADIVKLIHRHLDDPAATASVEEGRPRPESPAQSQRLIEPGPA